MAIAEQLNQLDEGSLHAALAKCCAANRWIDAMSQAVPFASDEAVLESAANIWRGLGRADWMEAFAAHPKIGDLDSLRAKFADTRQWAGREQSGVDGAAEETLSRLAGLNREYEARFGYIFIVCATGKTAEEMLTILEGRLSNEPAAELSIAAEEQLKITLLRLRKLGEETR